MHLLLSPPGALREKGGSGSLVDITSYVSFFISLEIKSHVNILIRITTRFPVILYIYVSFYLFSILSGLGMVEYFYVESEASVFYSNFLLSIHFALHFHFVIGLYYLSKKFS